MFAAGTGGYPIGQVGRRRVATPACGGDDAATKERTLPSEAKRGAQDALFTAIHDQAENNMHAALRPSEKARLLRDLAEAYRLTAGGSLPDLPRQSSKPAENSGRERTDDGAPRRASAR